MDTSSILGAESLEIADRECVVCFEKIININGNEYYEWLENLKVKYPNLPNNFEDETTSRCISDIMECTTCKNIVCSGCVCKTHQGIVSAKYSAKRINENGYESGICRLTDNQLEIINGDYGYDLKNKTDEELDLINKSMNNQCIKIDDTVYYGFMRGIPGGDGPIKCPICRQYNEVEM